MHQLFESLMTNLDCRVIILRDDGKDFCTGLDLKESMLLQSKKTPEEYKNQYYYLDTKEVIKTKIYFQQRISQIYVKMRKISQPIIAIIQGAASGGGFAFALASDIRIAGESARFNNAFIKLGLTGSDVSTSYFLPRLVGLSRAAEILYTGRFIDAKEAEKIGLVLKVVKDEELMDSALEIADELLNKSPLGLRMTKEAVNLSLDSPSLETMVQLENRAQMLAGASKDVFKGISAFFEKRKPKYPLR